MSELRWVLVAEDDDDIRQMIRQSLLDESDGLNLQIVEAKDGLDAISKANTREFHCVVTDLRMPRSTGEDLIRAMQSQPLNANTPTLVVSGHADSQEFAQNFSHIKVIPKPFMPSSIASAVVREIKLGRIDDRIAAHLINPFLEMFMQFLPEDFKLTPSLKTPQAKKSGESIIGDYHCTLILSTGLSRSRLTLSFDRTLLEYARSQYLTSRTSNWATMTPDAIARQLCLVAFEKAAPRLSALMGGSVRLTGTSIVPAQGDLTTESEYADLVRTSGITVLLATEHGRIVVSAFAKPKSKRI